jgi:hypothetical protein
MRISDESKKAWVITVNMGYGHQRTAYPLRFLAASSRLIKQNPESQNVINANDYFGMPEKDRIFWHQTRNFYEMISRFKKFPLLGDLAFSVFDFFQRILAFYPQRDLSKPNLTLRGNYSLIQRGFGRDLIGKLNIERGKPIPFITSFFLPAFMAERFDYNGEIFCIVCDADIARIWASLNPEKSRIKYFAPNQRVVERLRMYGIKNENIFLTGYPLPLENIGTEEMEILKENLRFRLLNLDPQKRYSAKYHVLIEKYLGSLPDFPNHPPTILFSVGGAGAQREIGISIVKSLKEKIKNKEVKIILSAGTKEKVKKYFQENVKKLGLEDYLYDNIDIIFQKNMYDYFSEFNKKLRKTDILWTKPSELSFYSALGIPIIIAPTIGSQEEFNKRWLIKSGYGMVQENPKYTEQWLFDWIKTGYLAEAAMQAFIEGEKLGVYNIQKIISQ